MPRPPKSRDLRDSGTLRSVSGKIEALSDHVEDEGAGDAVSVGLGKTTGAARARPMRLFQRRGVDAKLASCVGILCPCKDTEALLDVVCLSWKQLVSIGCSDVLAGAIDASCPGCRVQAAAECHAAWSNAGAWLLDV